jgi:hypothetical protein
MFCSTKVADELNNLPGFSSLLNSSAFDNNQVLHLLRCVLMRLRALLSDGWRKQLVNNAPR